MDGIAERGERERKKMVAAGSNSIDPRHGHA
jgi:hypothetical protein